MKKVLTVITIIAILVVCLSACELINANHLKYNDFFDVEYSEISIQIKTTTNGETLTNTFNVEKKDNVTTIDYKIEKLNTLSIENANEAEYKKEISGKVEVSGDKVTQLNGEAVNISFNRLSNPTFDFNVNYFANSETDENNFKADVTKPAKFMGIADFEATDMKVECESGEDCFKSIKVTYTDKNGSQVELEYTFISVIVEND